VSTVQLLLHDTVEPQVPGHVPPSACSTLPCGSGAGGSSEPEEQPSEASVINASAERMRVKVKEGLWFEVDMIFSSSKKTATPDAPTN
jgi:hypothetical protein